MSTKKSKTKSVKAGAAAVVVSVPADHLEDIIENPDPSNSKIANTGAIPKEKEITTDARIHKSDREKERITLPASHTGRGDSKRNQPPNVRLNPGSNCVLCDTPDTSRMVQCDHCDGWYHFSCVDVTSEIANLSWMCANCDLTTKKKTSKQRASIVSKSDNNPILIESISGKSSGRISNQSDARRRIELKLRKLEEEKQLEQRYLNEKYNLLQELASETSSIVSDIESAYNNTSKIQSWIANGEQIQQSHERSLVEEERRNIPRNSRISSNHSIRSQSGRRQIGGPQQCTRYENAISHTMRTAQNFPSNNRQADTELRTEALEFIPGQRSTPNERATSRPSLQHPSNETDCILNKSQLAARQAVSKDLPDFNGNPEDWPLFLSMFNSSTQMCGFSNEENMLRLRKCLKGKALEAVRCRLLHPSNVVSVMTTLKMLFGRPEAIVHAVTKKIRALPSPNIDKLETIVNFALNVENLCATIQACEVSDFIYNASLRFELIDRLPSALKLDWAKFSRNNTSPNLLEFNTWLYSLAEDASAVMLTTGNNPNVRGSRKEGFLNVHAELDTAQTNELPDSFIKQTNNCITCKGNCASVSKCKRFLELSYDSRWATVREFKLCRKCLRRHNGPCRLQKQCGRNGCTYLHHPLLHSGDKRRSDDSPTTELVHETQGTEETARSCNTHHKKTGEVLLKIIPVVLYGPSRTVRTYAFVDDGSELTLLEQGLADELGVSGPKKPLCLRWTGNQTRIESSSQTVRLEMSSTANQKRKYVLSNICTVQDLSLRPQTLSYEEIQQKHRHLAGLPIESYNDATPRILIGLDYAKLGTVMKCREGKSCDPIAVKTRLGWCIYGSSPDTPNTIHNINTHVARPCECNAEADNSLHKAMKEYFSLESLGISQTSKPTLSSDDRRAQLLLEKLTHLKGGRYESGLLWRYDNVRLPDSRAMAMSRWECLDRRMRKDPILAAEMQTQIRNYVDKGYICMLSEEELNIRRQRVWYLPVFPVWNPNKPGKTRMVWDAAATAHGISLNSVLLKGPDQLTSLPSVLYRFREFKIAVCGDIREMYHQVLMREDDQHCQRFFWKDERSAHPNVYIMKVMTFGASCSPSTAQFVMNQHAKMYENQFPAAVAAIARNHYVDDMLISVETEEEAIALAHDVKWIHAKGGFEMRNWITNSSIVSAALKDSKTKQKNLNVGEDNNAEKVLGMWWDTAQDCFMFKISTRHEDDLLSGRRRPTKREVLRVLMMTFDPLGLIAHFLMFLKVLLQEIWRSAINWDDQIGDPQFEKWLLWLRILPQIQNIRIPRCYRSLTSNGGNTEIQMHTFVDASENGFAAVVYLRYENINIIECSLVGAKTRVSPLKFLSIPRSELQASVIGARLADNIAHSLSISINKRFFWTDSRDVICWLKSDHRRYNQFVAFRISELLETTDLREWRWIPSKMNVADDGTKWKQHPDLSASSRWFQGPDFLRKPEDEWPKERSPIETTDTELRPHLLAHITVDRGTVIPVENFSKWTSLLRTTSYVLRFICNLQHKANKRPPFKGPLNQHEIAKAESCLFRLAQKCNFANEEHILSRTNNFDNTQQRIPRTSPIFHLCPFLDDNGVLRVRGRTAACKVIGLEAVHPVILPRDHHITRLIVLHYHDKFHHMNHETTMNELRQRFHISRLKTYYRTIRKECQRCKNDEVSPQAPLMGDLPFARLAAFTRPFTHMGIDYFGPITVSVGRRVEKRWGVLATCMTVRAIHLQVAHTLTTNSCIMALRNIMARRGTPAIIYSDRGTNFQGASKELQLAVQNLNQNRLMHEFTTGDTEWSFIPPGSPHMGGAWERLIRTVKQNLNKMKWSKTPTDEVLENTLVEIENVVNSRPLTAIPVDDDQAPVLTPNHFLLGSSNGLRPWVPFNDGAVALRNNWQMSQVMTNAFWKQWVRDYLPTLTRRTKWFENVKPIEMNDIVVIVDPKFPRNCWPKGRVISIHKAPDGQVRWATVQTSHGIYERPAVRLAVLDVRACKQSASDNAHSGGDC